MRECQRCHDTGWLPAEKGLAFCPCRRERQVRQVLPPRFHEARIAELPAARMQALGDWLKMPGDGLLICGPTGTGKTWAAAALTRLLIEAGRQVVWRPASEFFRELRESLTGHPGTATERDVLGLYSSTEFLVLDDLGAGAGSDFERRFAVEVIELRMNQLRPTIVTTNWTLQEISDRIDDRLASRLSAFKRLEFGGRDLRAGDALGLSTSVGATLRG